MTAVGEFPKEQARVVLASVGVAVLLAGVFLLLAPREYTAQAVLQLNSRAEQVTPVANVQAGLPADEAAARGELAVLGSRRLARLVLAKLANQGGNQVADLQTGWGWGSLTPAQRETAAVDRLLGHLEVSMEPRSAALVVRYRAPGPDEAALVVNTLTQAYVQTQLADRLAETQRANAWLTGRLQELQTHVQAAELAVRQYRAAHNLTESAGVTLTDQQLSELNSQLILARTQQAEAEAKQSAAGRNAGMTSEVLNSPLIQNLREQETEVRRQVSSLAARYGEQHPKMLAARGELADIQRKIGDETGKIQGSLGTDVAMARARVAALAQQLGHVQAQNNLNSPAQVQLAELERQAQASRALYEAFLTRSKEIAQLDYAQPDARVISSAEAPLAPSFPQPLLVLLVAVVAGGLIGVALAQALAAQGGVTALVAAPAPVLKLRRQA